MSLMCVCVYVCVCLAIGGNEGNTVVRLTINVAGRNETFVEDKDDRLSIGTPRSNLWRDWNDAMGIVGSQAGGLLGGVVNRPVSVIKAEELCSLGNAGISTVRGPGWAIGFGFYDVLLSRFM